MAKQKKESNPQPRAKNRETASQGAAKQQKQSTSRSVSKQQKTAAAQPKAPNREAAAPLAPKQQKELVVQSVQKPQPVAEEKLSIVLDQSVAILVDGNNIEMSLHKAAGKKSMINFDKLVPALLQNRALSRFIYFREGVSISQKLAERLQKNFHGSVVPCYKSADIPLTIKAVQVASKVDTIIILSGDADYVELVRHLKSGGIRVEVAAFPDSTAEVLRNESDHFFPITVDYSFSFK